MDSDLPDSTSNKKTILSLPNELLVRLCSRYCTRQDRRVLRQVCVRLRTACDDSTIWRNRVLRVRTPVPLYAIKQLLAERCVQQVEVPFPAEDGYVNVFGDHLPVKSLSLPLEPIGLEELVTTKGIMKLMFAFQPTLERLLYSARQGDFSSTLTLMVISTAKNLRVLQAVHLYGMDMNMCIGSVVELVATRHAQLTQLSLLFYMQESQYPSAETARLLHAVASCERLSSLQLCGLNVSDGMTTQALAVLDHLSLTSLLLSVYRSPNYFTEVQIHDEFKHSLVQVLRCQHHLSRLEIQEDASSMLYTGDLYGDVINNCRNLQSLALLCGGSPRQLRIEAFSCRLSLRDLCVVWKSDETPRGANDCILQIVTQLANLRRLHVGACEVNGAFNLRLTNAFLERFPQLGKLTSFTLGFRPDTLQGGGDDSDILPHTSSKLRRETMTWSLRTISLFCGQSLQWLRLPWLCEDGCIRRIRTQFPSLETLAVTYVFEDQCGEIQRECEQLVQHTSVRKIALPASLWKRSDTIPLDTDYIYADSIDHNKRHWCFNA